MYLEAASPWKYAKAMVTSPLYRAKFDTYWGACKLAFYYHINGTSGNIRVRVKNMAFGTGEWMSIWNK